MKGICAEWVGLLLSSSPKYSPNGGMKVGAFVEGAQFTISLVEILPYISVNNVPN
jgi:hypothetical protein